MARKTLYTTEFALTYGLNNDLSQVVKFLIEYRDCYIPSSRLKNIFQIKPIIPLPNNLIFDHLIATDKIDTLFSPIFMKGPSVPDAISSSDVVVDLKYINQANSLKNFPEFNNKTLINLTSILRLTTENYYTVTDINALHNIYIKALLTSSYHDSDGWLNPNLNLFIVRTYSMVLSSLIAKHYNLNLIDQFTIAAPFAIYMCQALDKISGNYSFPILFNKCTFLTNSSSGIETLVKNMENYTKKMLSIADVCNLIIEMGPKRIESFNPNVLYRLVANLCSTPVQMMIALELPPYWVYQLLMSVGNVKTKLFYELKQNRLLDECKSFVRELNTSRSFINEISR